MSTFLVVYLFVMVACFLVVCCDALHRGVTVWQLLATTFRDLARGFVSVFAAVGLAPRPSSAPRVSQRRIRELERELDIGADEQGTARP